MDLLCPDSCSEGTERDGDSANAGAATAAPPSSGAGVESPSPKPRLTPSREQLHVQRRPRLPAMLRPRPDGLIGATVRYGRAASGWSRRSARRTASQRSAARDRWAFMRGRGGGRVSAMACARPKTSSPAPNAARARSPSSARRSSSLRSPGLPMGSSSSTAPRCAQQLDDVYLVCAECAAELPGAEWSAERPRQVPRGEQPMIRRRRPRRARREAQRAGQLERRRKSRRTGGELLLRTGRCALGSPCR